MKIYTLSLNTKDINRSAQAETRFSTNVIYDYFFSKYILRSTFGSVSLEEINQCMMLWIL